MSQLNDSKKVRRKRENMASTSKKHIMLQEKNLKKKNISGKNICTTILSMGSLEKELLEKQMSFSRRL